MKNFSGKINCVAFPLCVFGFKRTERMFEFILFLPQNVLKPTYHHYKWPADSCLYHWPVQANALTFRLRTRVRTITLSFWTSMNQVFLCVNISGFGSTYAHMLIYMHVLMCNTYILVVSKKIHWLNFNQKSVINHNRISFPFLSWCEDMLKWWHLKLREKTCFLGERKFIASF